MREKGELLFPTLGALYWSSKRQKNILLPSMITSKRSFLLSHLQWRHDGRLKTSRRRCLLYILLFGNLAVENNLAALSTMTIKNLF